MKVGFNVGIFVVIGFYSIFLIWIWSNGELVFFNYIYVKILINDYDLEVYLCYYNYCGVLWVYFIVDIWIFDRCCINIFNLFVCLMFFFL